MTFRPLHNTLLFAFIAFFCDLSAQEEVRPAYDGVDRPVDNVGGKAELRRIFEQEMVYPERSLKENKGGTVTLKFLVMNDGSWNSLSFVKRLNAEIDAEAERIFRKLLFAPLVYRGEASSTWHTLSFRFDPKKYAKICKRRGYDRIVYKGVPDTSAAILEKADTMPHYAAGDFAMNEFIRKNLEYPRQAQLQNFSGTVLLSFVIEPSGMPTNIRVLKSVAGGCNDEAIRVLAMIRWEPGCKDGKLVRVKKSIPFIFELKNINRDNTIGKQQ